MAYYSEEEQRWISDEEQVQEFQSYRPTPTITNPITNKPPDNPSSWYTPTKSYC